MLGPDLSRAALLAGTADALESARATLRQPWADPLHPNQTRRRRRGRAGLELAALLPGADDVLEMAGATCGLYRSDLASERFEEAASTTSSVLG